jgi:hypothetical protein
MRTELLTVKELASVLKRAPGYVYAMRARGFAMPGNRTTVDGALQWLAANPHPRRRKK